VMVHKMHMKTIFLEGTCSNKADTKGEMTLYLHTVLIYVDIKLFHILTDF
jgi:hypothetical protein